MGKLHKHAPLAFSFPCFFLTVCLAIRTTNITTDQSALLALKAHIVEDPSHPILAQNWSASSSVCKWIGVTCSSRHLRVTGLNISHMNLAGSIPPHLGNLSFLVSLDMSSNNFQGELPNDFARFRRLQVLNLSFNSLTGIFPPWITSFKELQYLSLRNNSFTGLIPPSISNVTKLRTLFLEYNFLQGNIPAEIFNISSLEKVSLSRNSFSTGTLPDNICQHLHSLKWLMLEQVGLVGQIPSSIGRCLQLQQLYLHYNKLTGMIPEEIGNLKALEKLALEKNSFEGTIPKTIGNLTMLRMVDFNTNHLTGSILKIICNLTMLQYVSFHTNNLTGNIPMEIGNLQNIEHIKFGGNHLIGSVPVDLFNISTITVINFVDNNLSGHLPLTMGYGLPNLLEFTIAANNFDGPIPLSILNCSQLLTLELSQNYFTGDIPNSLGDLSLLQRLKLFDNNLISDPSSPFLNFISSLANCKSLKRISLSDNPLNGILPDSVGNLSSSLEEIYAYNCGIRGTIPSGMGNLSGLHTVALQDNLLTGSLPASIKNMQNLQRIDLYRNDLTVFLRLFCFCQNLGYLDLDENPTGGSIPECFGNMTSLRYLYLSSNGLNSSVPKSFWNQINLLELNLSSNSLRGFFPPEISNLKSAILMDLSGNYFSGGIPNTVGDLQNLQALYLAHNRLQGSIPETIGSILSLETLDLSYNLLSGSLPMSLEKLQYLASFNVSFNNLSGEIPPGGPFSNFTVASFISNEELCGAQRFGFPPCPSTPILERSSGKVHRIVYILLGTITVVVVGATCFGFFYIRRRRKQKAPNDQEGLSLITQERISYYKLLQATNGYNQSNLLGTGSFGSVYKGTLDDGRIVAVKVFNLQLEGSFKSFETECEVLRNIRHRNLAKVVSSCSNPDFKALVLDYMPNGSLEKWLYSKNYFLNVMQRLNILIDVANALQYLHCGNLTPVVHCDLKPSNVLLDHDLVAHVSDFGISKLLGQENSIAYTKTLATICYLAPEYGSEGLVSKKCDVYSFGIMMMEAFTGKSPSNEIFVENLSLKSWVTESMPNGLTHVIDANLLRASGNFSPETLACISSIMQVALACTEDLPSKRSNIQDVLPTLNKIKLQLLSYTEGPKQGVGEISMKPTTKES